MKNVKEYVKKVSITSNRKLTSNRNVKRNKKRIYKSNKYIGMYILYIYIYIHIYIYVINIYVIYIYIYIYRWYIYIYKYIYIYIYIYIYKTIKHHIETLNQTKKEHIKASNI